MHPKSALTSLTVSIFLLKFMAAAAAVYQNSVIVVGRASDDFLFL